MNFSEVRGGVRRALIALAVWSAGAVLLPAQEVQQHGLKFEEWVRNTFFGGYKPTSYTQRWDIPASANIDRGGVPANPKAVKYGTPVDLGDALRQFEIDHSFLLIIGFWEQRGDEKHFVKIIAPEIDADTWRALWAPITYADILRLDQLIKDTSRPIEQTRHLALQMKKAPPFSEAIMQVNPKIDARQRRLQCSLRFSDVFQHLAPGTDSSPEANPSLWGTPFPGPIVSPARN